MEKFKFKSNKKNKFNLIEDKTEINKNDIIMQTHSEIFSNKLVIIEGCKSIIDYKNDYIKLKLKKGYINFLGNNFKITYFEQQKIIIDGIISTIEFCV